MDPFVLGSLISSGSSFLGGLLDRKDQRAAPGNEMRQKIETGREYGLHPLVSIGAQTSGYQPVMSQAMSSAGQSIQTGLAERANAKAAASMAKKQEALIDEQILEARSRTMLNQANARRALVGPGAPADPFAMRKENAWIQVRLKDGTIVEIPNPDVHEISLTEALVGAGLLQGARIPANTEGRRLSFGKIDAARKGTGVGGSQGSLRW